MNLIYITNTDFENKNLIGVKNKCIEQGKSFYNNDVDIYLVYNKGLQQYISSKNRIYLFNSFNNKFSNKFFRFYNLINYIESNNIKYIYIRHVYNTDIFMINFLKKVRNKVEKIYLEIPTYPYDGELNKFSYAYIFDSAFRKYLKSYIDKIITFSDEDFIFDIPTINIDNGVDLKNIKLKKNNNINENNINLIAVANVSFWHGYDRVIEGLNKYYNNNKNVIKKYVVKFNIVGEGEELCKLEALVEKYNLSNFVKFYGFKLDNELDYIFDKCDIAVAALGSHRKGIKSSSALKVKEYCARGIPFIHSCYENGFNQNEEFLMKISEDDSYLNIDSVIEFYEKIKPSYNDIMMEMRRYAEEKFSWDTHMKKVIEDFER